MDIPELINKTTVRAINYFGDEAAKKFYEGLKAHKFLTTQCRACGHKFFYPRLICPKCYSTDLEWIELSGKGKLYAFTQQEKSLRFSKPDVVGLVELEEGVGRIITRIDAKFEDLRIGMSMQLAFVDISEELTLHQFKPI